MSSLMTSLTLLHYDERDKSHIIIDIFRLRERRRNLT